MCVREPFYYCSWFFLSLLLNIGGSWHVFDRPIFLQRENLVEVFYEKHLDQLIDVLTSSCLPHSSGQIGSKSMSSDGESKSQSTVKPDILLNICELLSFCVVQHSYRIK